MSSGMSSGPGPGVVDADVQSLLDRLRCLSGRTYAVSELGGGLTNRNFRVTTTDDGRPGDYVVRVSANESGLLAIDRVNERLNTWRASEAGVGAPVVEALPEDNVLVVGFLSGRTLTATDLRDRPTLLRVAEAVRMLHAGPEFAGSFDMRSIRRRYLDIVVANDFRLPDDYHDLAPLVERLEDAMRPGDEPLVPCNNDLLAGELHRRRHQDLAHRLRVLGHERSQLRAGQHRQRVRAGRADHAGARGGVLGRESDPARLARARAWSLLARYGWTLWASIQDGVSPIDFDFWAWGMDKYESARAELLGPEYDEIREGLA